MRRYVLSLIGVILVSAPPGSMAGDFSCQTNGSTVLVTGYSGSGGDITIPGIIDTLPVTGIGDSVFNSSVSLTSVIMPDSITNIGDSAFYSCTSLTNIVFPRGLTGIGGYAFYYCSSLARITISSNLTSLGEYAFGSCSKLAAAYFRGNAPGSGSTAFSSGNTNIVYYLPLRTGWNPTFGGRPARQWNPSLQTDSAGFNPQAGGFGLRISGTTNIPVLLEACTNLVSPVWIPLLTNTLTTGSVSFSDIHWTNYPTRFYHVRAP